MGDPVSTRKTLLFSGHDLKFIRRFIARCQNDPRYRVLIDEHPGHQITKPEQCLQLLPSADVIFCEWCLGNAKWYSQRKQPGQRLIIRLHHQEMELPYRYELEWQNVDAIVFTNFPHYHRFCREQPQQRSKAVVVFCDVDCDGLDREKLPMAEFNLGLVGMNPMRKRPDLAFEILRKLRQDDSRYTLFFKSRMPWEYKWLWDRPHERDYFNRFLGQIEASPDRDSVLFEAHGDDMSAWFSKIGFILSTSDHEGSHQAVAEGMAAGCIPLVRSWDGAAPLYPAKFIFSSVDEAVELIRQFRTAQVYAGISVSVKAYARDYFSERRMAEQIEVLFKGELASGLPPVPIEIDGASAGAGIPRVMVLGYLPAGFRGGYRIRIEQEIEVLTRQGCRVHLACLHPDGGDPASLEAHRRELLKLGCAVSLIPVKGFFDLQLNEGAIRETLELLQGLVEQHDFRILHAEALYCTRIGLLLRQRCPYLQLIFDCHGTSPEEEQMGGAHPARVSEMRKWERRALAEVDLRVFVSEAMRDFYQAQYGLNGAAHTIVPCCVAEERFPRDQAVSVPANLPLHRPIIAYVGTLASWQCGEEMIRLFAQLYEFDPEVFFLMLLPQTDHTKARDLLRAHHLPESAVLLTETPHEQVAGMLRHAHAGLLLRRAHPVNRVASPTKFGEYLAAGLPVIMTDGIGDFSRMATRLQLGLVLDPKLLDRDRLPQDEVSRIIAFVRGSLKLRRQVAGSCRGAVRRHLHWDVASSTLLNAYRDLSANRRSETRPEHHPVT